MQVIFNSLSGKFKVSQAKSDKLRLRELESGNRSWAVNPRLKSGASLKSVKKEIRNPRLNIEGFLIKRNLNGGLDGLNRNCFYVIMPQILFHASVSNRSNQFALDR